MHTLFVQDPEVITANCMGLRGKREPYAVCRAGTPRTGSSLCSPSCPVPGYSWSREAPAGPSPAGRGRNQSGGQREVNPLGLVAGEEPGQEPGLQDWSWLQRGKNTDLLVTSGLLCLVTSSRMSHCSLKAPLPHVSNRIRRCRE